MTSEQLEETIVDRKGQFLTVVMLVARVKKAKIILILKIFFWIFLKFSEFFSYQKENAEPNFDAKSG